MALTTSALLSHEVYLTDRLDNLARERMPHLKCICFLRPSPESLRALEEELRNPRYSGYWLFFSNTLKKSAIERLAEADEGELVREVQVSRCMRQRPAVYGCSAVYLYRNTSQTTTPSHQVTTRSTAYLPRSLLM
jgi:hypothetical protein